VERLRKVGGGVVLVSVYLPPGLEALVKIFLSRAEAVRVATASGWTA